MRSRLTPAVLILLATAGCETSPELPTEFEGPPTFSRISIDQLSLSPPLGSELVVGRTIEYNAVAHWELTQEDYDALVTGEYPNLSFVLNTSWNESTFFYGGLEGLLLAADTLGPTGSMRLDGTLTIPASSGTCGPYDRLNFAAAVGDAIFDVQNGESLDKTSTGLGVVVSYPVVGAVGLGLEAVCVWNDLSARTTVRVWGSLFTIEVVNLTVDQVVEVFIDDTPAALEERWWYPENAREEGAGLGVFNFTVAPGTQAGVVTAYLDGQPVPIGGPPMIINAVGEVEDPFDPINDDWRQAVEAFAHVHPRILMLWRGLALTEADRIPNPALNPLGSSEYGVGDWWRLTMPYELPLCARIHRDSRDEIDLILTREDGTLVNTQLFPTSAWVGMAAPVLPEGETYLLWVAPRSIGSDLGAYVLAVGDCIQFGRRKGFPPLDQPLPTAPGVFE